MFLSTYLDPTCRKTFRDSRYIFFPGLFFINFSNLLFNGGLGSGSWIGLLGLGLSVDGGLGLGVWSFLGFMGLGLSI